MRKCFFTFALALFTFLAGTVFAQNTAIIPTPRTFPTNWMSRHLTYVAQAKQGGIDLLFLGDSITDGWRWGKGGVNVWKNYYASRHAADFGIGYDRIQNVLWRVENGELEVIHPKVIVLLIGTNNLGNEDNGKPRNSTPEVVEGITAIVHELRTRLPESKVLLLGIFPRGHQDDPARDQLKEVNSKIAQLADGKMVTFLDIGPKFLGPNGTLSRDIMPDLLHPSERGYQIWAEAMDGTLTEMMK